MQNRIPLSLARLKVARDAIAKACLDAPEIAGTLIPSPFALPFYHDPC